MTNQTSSLKLLLLAAGLVGFASGCAEERDPINRVQANGLKKTFFVGKIADQTDDPEFYTSQTVIDVPYGADQPIGAFTGLLGDMKRVKFEVTEDALNARLSYEEINGVDNHGSRVTNNGRVIGSYRISSHFDIKRSYNPSTGEELNVLEENQSDRPWYDREYMRVDWSTNLIESSWWDPLDQSVGFGAELNSEPLSYYVSDPHHPDAPVFVSEDGYFDFVNRYNLSPKRITIAGVERVACYYRGSLVVGATGPWGNCESSEISVRASFRRVPQPGDPEYTDYEPIDYDGSRMNAFGMFWVTRLGWDNHYGVVDDQWYRFGQRHNIWMQSHAKDPVTGDYIQCAKPIDVANGVNSNRDDDGDGTEDECVAGGAGSRCDTLMGQCTIPYAKREVRPIVWRYTVNGEDVVYLESSQFATWEWDTAMRIAVQAARRVECVKTGGKSLDGTSWQGQPCESAFPINSQDDAEFERVQSVMRCWQERGWGDGSCYSDNGIAQNEIAAQKPVVILCRNPVAAGDPQICGKEGYTVRPGDIRYHHVAVWPTRQNSSPWGYGPSQGDPLTGEIISVGINVYSSVTDQTAQSFLDTMRWVNGEVTSDEITTGSYIRGWTRANQSAETSPAAWPSFTREEADRRVQSLGGLTPERLQLSAASGKVVPAAQLAQLDQMLYNDRLPNDMPGLGPSVNAKADARLEMIKGSPIEAELMHPMWLQMAGIDSKSPIDESVLEQASPIRDLHPRNIIAREQRLNTALARKGQCMVNAPEPTGLPAFAKVMAKKFPADSFDSSPKGQADRTKAMWDFLRYKMHYSVILHEMGHTFGQTHNYVGSYDKFNYRPQYWQLRTKSGEVTEMCEGRTGENPSNCIGPRYFDPLDEQEAEESIWTWMHTTVMDYPGDLTHDTLGLGVYDYAAARFFYGDTVDVRNDGKFPTATYDFATGADVGGTATPEGNAIRSLVDYAGYLFGQTFSIGNRNPHHTEMHNLFQMLWDCKAVNPTPPAHWDESKFGVWDAVFDGHIVRNEVCSRAPVDYVSWSQLIPDRVSRADDPKFFIPRRARTADGLVRMPYGMQPDWYADSGYPSANRHDNGADMYEEIVFHSSLYENRHIFDNFRNYRSTFNIYGAYSRALARYHAKVGTLTGGFAYTVGFILDKFAKDYGYNWDDVVASNIAPGSFLYDHTVAASAGLDHFARAMMRPQPGLHFRYGPTDNMAHSDKDLFLSVNPAQQQVIVTLPNGSSISEDGSLFLGARPVQNEFNYSNGAWNSDYLNQVGSYYEKVLIPNLMLQADTFSLNFYRFDALDTRPRFVNLSHLWPDGFRQMAGMMLTDDQEVYAPRLAMRSNGIPDVVPDPNNSEIEYPAKPLGWVSWVGSAPQVCWTNASKMNCTDSLGGALGPNPNYTSMPIEPQWGYEEQKFLLLWLYAYQPESQVWDWVDMMRIYRTGKDIDPAYLPAARIEHLDYESGLRYVAKRYGNEQIFGKTYDKGVAAKMIGWANTLAGMAFQLDPTTPYDPVTGTPNYVLDAAGKPVVKADPFVAPTNPNAIRCDENRYCKQLRQYRGLLDFARDMAARVGFPEPALQVFN